MLHAVLPENYCYPLHDFRIKRWGMRTADAGTSIAKKLPLTVPSVSLARFWRQYRPLMLAIAGMAMPNPVLAQNWTGVESADWMDGRNWSGGAPPTTGDVYINTVSPHPTIIGYGNTARTVSIGWMAIGADTNATANGNLIIQSGSTLTSRSWVVTANRGGSATMTVTGAGSAWNIDRGGLELGYNNAASVGRVIIADQGTLTIGALFYIGGAGSGGGNNVNSSLEVSSGGQFITNGAAQIAGKYTGDAGTAGTLTVTGSGSRWTANNQAIKVGYSGSGRSSAGTTGGTLNIADGGTVTANAGIVIADTSSATGTLNLHNGILETPSLRAGNGAKQVNFNGGTLRALAGSADFISGFTGAEFNLAAGGMTVDSNGFDIASASVFSGVGGLTKKGDGTLTLSANNTYSGGTTINAGTLRLNGTLASGVTATGGASVLTGDGAVSGDVKIVNGATLHSYDDAADGQNRLTIDGKLTVDATSIMRYDYSQDPNVGQDVLAVNVNGDVDLNGTVKVTHMSGIPFGPGVYTIVRYTGSRTGVLKADASIANLGLVLQQGVVAGEINLVHLGSGQRNWWNPGGTAGSITGGNGIWTESQSGLDNANWVDAAGNNAGHYDPAVFAIFAGAAGAVKVDPEGVTTPGMQFLTDGYRISGGAITMNNASGVGGSTPGQTVIIVGAGSDASDAYIVTIDSVVQGTDTLVKEDMGTLALRGTNLYSGGTIIREGTIRISRDANLGAATGALTFDGQSAATAILNNTSAVTMTRDIRLDGAGTFKTDADLTLHGGISGAGALVKTGMSDLILAGDNTYTGATLVDQGTLAAGTPNVFSAHSAFDIAQNATLALRGMPQKIGGLVNAGTVDLGGGNGPGAVLTINGDYTGRDGSVVVLHTRIGDDNSKTDRLVVLGNAQGKTTLVVNNVDGRGAPTFNGIKLVDVHGASDANFVLRGDYEDNGDQLIVVGAYSYRLLQGGIDGDWYLRSELSGGGPQFHAGVPVYEAYAGVMQSFNQLDSLQGRLGNRFWSGAGGLSEEVAAGQGETAQNFGIWGSIRASEHRFHPEHSSSRTDYDAAVWKAETGIDGPLHESESGRLIGGVSLHYGTISSSVDSPHGAGKIDSTGYGLGGTLTWYGNDGLYVDGQARYTRYDSDLNSETDIGTLTAGNGGDGYGLSIEVGKRVPFRSGWYLAPQAQLTWSKVTFDGFTDSVDSDVFLKDGDNLRARTGLAIETQREWREELGMTRRLHAYGIANLYYDFESTYTVDVDSISFETRNPPFWGGIGLGGSYNWHGDKYSIYGETLVKTSFKAFADSYVLAGNIGFRVKW
jgi:fibronectin-binding autotransporter adhesin